MRVKESDLYPHLDYLRLIEAFTPLTNDKLSDFQISARGKCLNVGIFLWKEMKRKYRGERGVIC